MLKNQGIVTRDPVHVREAVFAASLKPRLSFSLLECIHCWCIAPSTDLICSSLCAVLPLSVAVFIHSSGKGTIVYCHQLRGLELRICDMEDVFISSTVMIISQIALLKN